MSPALRGGGQPNPASRPPSAGQARRGRWLSRRHCQVPQNDPVCTVSFTLVPSVIVQVFKGAMISRGSSSLQHFQNPSLSLGVLTGFFGGGGEALFCFVLKETFCVPNQIRATSMSQSRAIRSPTASKHPPCWQPGLVIACLPVKKCFNFHDPVLTRLLAT